MPPASQPKPAPRPAPPRTRQVLAQYLDERDVPCPSCGYNLRGLTTDRCPECSQELGLRVHAPPRRIAQLPLAVIALGVGAGFGALLLLAYATRLWMDEAPATPAWTRLAWFAVGVMALHALAMTALLAIKHRFAGMRARARAGVVVGAWLLAASSVLVFLLLAR